MIELNENLGISNEFLEVSDENLPISNENLWSPMKMIMTL